MWVFENIKKTQLIVNIIANHLKGMNLDDLYLQHVQHML